VRKDDWRIEEDIRDQFLWTPYVDGEQIAVAVNDGVATLTGTVDSWFEYRAAAQNAYEGGARKVVNKLRVRVR
jgi:osmotically-inducible protein OsmY